MVMNVLIFLIEVLFFIFMMYYFFLLLDKMIFKGENINVLII